MKYLNRKLIDKKKNSFYLKKINKYFIFLLFIFFFGIWTERFDLKNYIINFSKEIINIGSNRIFSIFGKNVDKLVIDINYENYSKILSSREKSIKSYRASEDIHKWVGANMTLNNEKYKIRLKLKGVHSEHWKDPKKWSFKIKLLENKAIDGFKRFSIQQPKTRDYLYEWLFMKVLEKEGLIFHRVKFLETNVNGENLGIYFLEEQHSKQLIENNKRREGPIIGLDKNLWINEANNLKDLTINVLGDSFWRAKIKPVQFNEEKIGTEQELYLKNAINLFEDFRNNRNKLNQTFDISQLAKLMAVKAMFGSSEFDWRDIKFYYNPITALLEPIGREVHIDKNFSNINAWWIYNENNIFGSSDDLKFPSLLFSDKKFYELYLTELFRLTEKNYINEIINENKNQYKQLKTLLKLNFPTEDIITLDHFENTKNIIRKTLDPIQGINAYYLDYKNNKLIFSIQNTQRLPVILKNLILSDNQILPLDKTYLIDGKGHNKPVKNFSITVSCESIKNKSICEKNIDNNDFIKDNSKISYNVLGQKKEKKTDILKFYKVDETITKTKLLFNLDELENLSYLNVDKTKKSIDFNQESIVIKNRILIPSGFKINIKPGTKITFEEDGQIITYSPVFIDGKIDNPVFILANENKIYEVNKYGNGISIINANSKSVINNTFFSNLRSPQLNSGEGLLGGINIYNSEVIIKNCNFTNNKGEDFLNIISSNFLIENVKMDKINFDAIDFDFSKGTIDGISIYNAGNDALDFSGSNVFAKNILINKAGDKGVSAGEQSKIKISNIDINKSNIGIASKDLSTVEVNNIEVEGSNIVAAAYQKKPEFGPGFIEIKKINISNNENTYLAQKNSVIKVNNEIMSNTNINYSEF